VPGVATVAGAASGPEGFSIWTTSMPVVPPSQAPLGAYAVTGAGPLTGARTPSELDGTQADRVVLVCVTLIREQLPLAKLASPEAESVTQTLNVLVAREAGTRKSMRSLVPRTCFTLFPVVVAYLVGSVEVVKQPTLERKT